MDLKLRGPGDLGGTQQSGVLDLKLADLSRDQQLLVLTRNEAIEILTNDPSLETEENKCIIKYIRQNTEHTFWAKIS